MASLRAHHRDPGEPVQDIQLIRGLLVAYLNVRSVKVGWHGETTRTRGASRGSAGGEPLLVLADQTRRSGTGRNPMRRTGCWR